MSKSSQNARADRECTSDCKSTEHALLVLSAITKRGVSDRQLAAYLSSLCCNVGNVHDEYGKTALHMAASCGRYQLALWLVSAAKSDMNAKDRESGYTPLHRSLFYGHVNIAVKLIKMGASMTLTDHEFFTPIALTTWDRPPQMKISKDSPCQVYIWGSNKNYTIGTGTGNARKHPKLLNQFGKNNFSIKQVAMDEFHSVFVSGCGRVWTCGLGLGGRLGTGSQKPALVPLRLPLASSASSSCHPERCSYADAALNHTLLLLANGTVLAFGLNSHHQLGIVPFIEASFQPRPICMEPFKQKIVGVCAARYHSVFYTRNALFVCGTNGGQLGSLDSFPNSSSVITTPAKAFEPKGDTIHCVASSTGAIVLVVDKGFILCIHKYQCRRIARLTRPCDIVKLCVVGGTIDTDVIPEAAAEDLKVAVLTSLGEVFLWDQSSNGLNRCQFKMKTSVSDICLTHLYLLFTTRDGEAFEATVKDKIPVLTNNEYQITFVKHKLNRLRCELPGLGNEYVMKSKKLQYIHRAVAISADTKGNNFAVIQVHPKASLTLPQMSESEIPGQLKRLLEEASIDDCLHDVVFSVGGRLFPAHRYILSLSRTGLSEIAQVGGTVEIENVKPYIFEQLLLFIYTGHNDIVCPGPFPLSVAGYKEDPVKQLHEVSCKFKVQELIKKLSTLRYFNGAVILKEGCSLDSNSTLQMDRALFPEFCDIKLKATDGVVIEAHKCVLAARLHYFETMLTGGWAESASSRILKLQFNSSVLKDLIDFLYTEKVPDSLSPDDLDHTVSLVIAADQLFVNNLREACEIVLCEALTLTNAATVLQLSLTYNMEQLKKATLEFMSLNLDAILESRILENFGDEILEELNNYYRTHLMRRHSSRIITPFSDAPSDEVVLDAAPILWPDDLEEIVNKTGSNGGSETKKTKNVHNTTKKRNHRKSIQDTPIEEEIETVEKGVVCEPQMNNSSPVKVEPEAELWLESQFPTLDSNMQHKNSTVKISPSNRKIFVPKLSQKQKKKILNSAETKSESPPAPKFKGWGKIPDLPIESINNLGSPTSDNSDEKKQQFQDIVASEKEERNNWVRMKEKLFTLTQIEDKAMEDLLDFYNAYNISDERITIQRVLPANVAKPIWIRSHK